MLTGFSIVGYMHRERDTDFQMCLHCIAQRLHVLVWLANPGLVLKQPLQKLFSPEPCISVALVIFCRCKDGPAGLACGL